MSDQGYDDMYEELAEQNPEALIAVGFEKAYVGHTAHSPTTYPCAVYDANKCLRILMQDGLSYTEAIEHLEFNVIGAYVGEGTPIFVWSRHP